MQRHVYGLMIVAVAKWMFRGLFVEGLHGSEPVEIKAVTVSHVYIELSQSFGSGEMGSEKQNNIFTRSSIS
jgi:hypothetical protein